MLGGSNAKLLFYLIMNNHFIESKWKIFVWINLLWILGTIALGYIAYTSAPPVGSSNFIESAKIIFLSLGGLGVVLPTYINAFNAIEGRQTQKIENTFRLIEKWDDPLMFEARKFTRELKLRQKSLSANELISEIDNNPELKQSTILVMNYFDQIRISEETKRINVPLFNRSLGPVMQDYCHRLRPYVEKQGAPFLADWDRILELSKQVQ